MAAVMRQPGHPLLRARLDKLWSLLGAATDADERVNAAQWILAAAAQRGSFDDVPRAVAIVEPVLDEPRLSPLLRAHWYRRLGYVLYLQGEYEAALAWLQKGQAIARQHEFHGALALGLYGLTLAAVALGDVERAQAELLLFEAAGPPLRNAELAVWHHARSLVALHKGDFDAAFAGARAAAAAAIETGWPHMATLRHLQLAFMHAEVGEHAAATAEVQRTQQLIAGTPLQFYDCGLALVQAYIALKQQDLPLCHALLARALAQARATGYVFITRFLPDALPRLFEQALAAGIEPDYTREVIKRLRVLPAAGAGASWPWPLKILTLGSFEVWTDDTRLVFRRKAQKKPMDLLKALIAMGGRGVEASRLAEALWPDSDGDVAHKALETTLYRMRKLVRHDGLVHLGDGKLSLDARRVWIDTWAFQQALQPGPSSAARASPAATQQLLALYRADFLAAEPEEPWMLPLRLRLRDQWLGWLRDQGHELERRGEPGAAEALYRRGLEIDPSDENLYRRLMTSQRDRGDLAEAARTYRRCTEVLANLLGTRPCEATEAIRRSLAPSAAQPR